MRLGERCGSPGAPMDGVVLVLEEVRAGFMAEEVFAHGGCVSRDVEMPSAVEAPARFIMRLEWRARALGGVRPLIAPVP